jgi:hypothetical protein
MEKETEDFAKEAFQQTLDAKTNLMQDFHGPVVGRAFGAFTKPADLALQYGDAVKRYVNGDYGDRDYGDSAFNAIDLPLRSTSAIGLR